MQGPVPYRTSMASVGRHVAATVLLAGALWTAYLPEVAAEWLDSPPPQVPHVQIDQALYDLSAVPVTTSALGHRLHSIVTADALRTDRTLWRRMHVADWNAVPPAIRNHALDAMMRRYRSTITEPERWAAMTAVDWDEIPQPVRAMAFCRMVEHWRDVYDVGARFALDESAVDETLAAIVMSESWFEHRAEYTGPDGRRDVGLGQTSAWTRDRMRRLYAEGLVDVYLTDDDYVNPWHATRFVAIWMNLLLDEVDGDLDMAVRAYHRGVRRAMDARGSSYLAMVEHRRHRFIANHDGTPAWDYIWRRVGRWQQARRTFHPASTLSQ
jgi:hypothetical protein